MEKVKYLILGAGVSGLSFAKNINSTDYVIIEKNNEAGGYCRTKEAGEYIWDYAGHFFHFSHLELREYFKTIMGSDEVVRRVKNTKIYYKGYYIDYPFQKNIHQLTKDEMIDCIYDLFDKTEKERYENFLDMLYGKFGKAITEKFLKPYNEKLYACNLNSLDVNAMGRFFPYADPKEIIMNMKKNDNSSYNQTFVYPKKGAVVFIKKLLETIPDNKIKYNEEVIAINIKDKIIKTKKNEYKYEYLISSIPLYKFVELARIDIDHSVFSYNQVLVFNLGFDKPSVEPDIHWIYVPDQKINFYRIGYYNNIIGSKNLSMYIEIGYPQNYKITQSEIDNQLDKTIYNLKKIGVINTHKLIASQALVMDPAYVHITARGQQILKNLKASLHDENVYMVGRYGNWKYCSIEDCMIDSLNVISEIKESKR